MQNRPFTTSGNVCASVQRQATLSWELLTPFNVREAMHSEPRIARPLRKTSRESDVITRGIADLVPKLVRASHEGQQCTAG
jgi:hypothetical protein